MSASVPKTASPRPTREQLLALLSSAFPVTADDLLQPLLQFMTVARGLVGGDTDKILLMMVIGVRTFQHPDFGRLAPEKLNTGEMRVLPSLGTNVRSIAESIDMPKETVRRKIGELVEAGWLVREDHDLRYTPESFAAMEPAREAVRVMAVRNFELVRQLLEREGLG